MERGVEGGWRRKRRKPREVEIWNASKLSAHVMGSGRIVTDQINHIACLTRQNNQFPVLRLKITIFSIPHPSASRR